MRNRRQFLQDVAGASAGMFLLGRGASDVLASTMQTAATPKRREVFVGGRRVKSVRSRRHSG